jgi:Helicase associated domain.
MTQDEKWNIRYAEVKSSIEGNHRNPSKHRIEEHDMLNWVKQQRKVMSAGKMKEERVERFKELMELCDKFRRKNQYE